MSEQDKEKYYALERKDRERFERESAEADAERLAEQERRRNAQFVQEGEHASSRGARKALDDERQRLLEEKAERRAQPRSNTI